MFPGAYSNNNHHNNRGAGFGSNSSGTSSNNNLHDRNPVYPQYLAPQRKRRPQLEAVCTQMNPEQSSASASLYDSNPALSGGHMMSEYDATTETGNSDHSAGRAGDSRILPFSFACELAHGSNQVRVSGFSNIPELYQRIAENFSIPVSQIMYCTLDTPQVDMTKLLGNQLSFNHVIYAHTRGQTKEVRFLKSAEALGLTVSDNKAGGVFVKRISNTGVLAKVLEQQPNSICPGDLIECINGRSFINSRHMEVVKYLKELPLNSKIVLRLISPEKNLLPGISKRQKRSGALGRQTIRITATGAEVTEALNRDQSQLLRRLAETVEEYIGIADEELAQSIFDLECRSATKEDFFEMLKNKYAEFEFPPRFAEKFWTAYDYYLDSVSALRN